MHKLLTNSPGKAMFLLGNEAIARGALEAGMSFATCYPGTPSSEIPAQFFLKSPPNFLISAKRPTFTSSTQPMRKSRWKWVQPRPPVVSERWSP
jgi:TPP-dependent indolepyruvate ferredoxin oxidoreductase alpha subunit